MQKKYAVLFILSVLSVITFLDRTAISLAGQRITHELGLSEIQFGWILGAFTIAYGLFEIPTGLLGDKWGAKKVLARVVIWWSLFTVLTGFAAGFASLFVIRFLFGAGEAGAYPNTAIAIKEWFPGTERGRAQSVIWMCGRMGGAIAPFIVIPLQIQFGWRTSFYILGLLGLAWVIFWLYWYKSKETKSPLPGDAEQRKSSRVVFWKYWFNNRNFWFLMIMYYCYASGVFFFISWLPKYLQNGRGIKEADLKWTASLPFILAAAGCLAGGALSDYLVKKIGTNKGRRIVPRIGLCLSGSAMLLAAFTPDNTMAVVLLSLAFACMDVTAPVSWAVATDLGGENSGAMTGAMNTAGLIGGTVTSFGIGYLITSSGSYRLPVIILGLLLIAGGLLWTWIRAADDHLKNEA